MRGAWGKATPATANSRIWNLGLNAMAAEITEGKSVFVLSNTNKWRKCIVVIAEAERVKCHFEGFSTEYVRSLNVIAILFQRWPERRCPRAIRAWHFQRCPGSSLTCIAL